MDFSEFPDKLLQEHVDWYHEYGHWLTLYRYKEHKWPGDGFQLKDINMFEFGMWAHNYANECRLELHRREKKKKENNYGT